jgi:peptidoglycan hydrolase-like protein with peptidoglycan-binding domain
VITGLLQQKLNQANKANGGQRISVTSLFDGGTETALKKFQADNGLPVTGVADVATWTELDKAAPSEMRNGQLRVEDADQAQTVKPLAGVHPELSFPTHGAAVRELQERLNNWQKTVVGKKPFSIMSVDGIFGLKTRSALKDFQKAHGLPENATADDATWAELDKQGAVQAGVRQLSWDQIVEGNRSGMESKYNWEVTKDNRLVITVAMEFTGEKKHPKVAQWIQDIKDVWNGFKAVEDGGARSFDIEFKPVVTGGGHKIRVGKPTPTNPNPRSDAANWYVNDNRKGLAPHEFGHLIGLADEYNRPEEQYVESTGQEPAVGSLGTSAGSSVPTIVDNIHDAIANNARGPAVSRALAKVVKDEGLRQGGVARLVAERYVAKYPFQQDFLDSAARKGAPATFTTYLAYAGGDDYTSDMVTATQAFSESNTSIMGTMTSVPENSDAAGIAAIAPHDHPVQPRHLRSFVDLLVVAMPGSKWKTEKR